MVSHTFFEPRRFFCALLLFASALLSSSASAQRLWPDPVDTVDVVAPRPNAEEAMAARSGFSTYVPLGGTSSRDLADLLDRTAGIHVHRFGGLGALSVASVRGSSAGQVTVCLDGVPLAAAGEGFVNLSLLPLSSLEHAEIYRGPQAATFGGPPAAGVINLVTPPASPVPLRVAMGVASFGTRTARGQWGAGNRFLAGLISGEYRQSRGDFPYLNRNGTDYQNTADDRVVRRRNNDFADASVLFKASLHPAASASTNPGSAAQAESPVRLDYTLQRLSREGGVPGTENDQTRHVRSRTDRIRHEASVRARPLGGFVARRVAGFAARPQGGFGAAASSIVIEGSVHRDDVNDRYENRDGELGLGRAASENRTREEGARVTGSVLTGPLRQKIRATLEVRRERLRPRDLLLGSNGFTRKRDHRTVLLEDRWILGRLMLEGNYRLASATDNYAGPIAWGVPPDPSEPRRFRQEGLTAGGRLDLDGGLSLKANRGAIERFPSFPELFGQNGIQDGNPALKPEHGMQWDAGFVFAPDRPVRLWRGRSGWLPLRLESAYYESVVGDRISLLQNSQRTTKAQNLDRSWIRGIESSAWTRVTLSEDIGLELQGELSWQEARDRGRSPTYRGKRLPNLPEREGFSAASLTRGAWGLRWEVSSRSSAYRDRYNSAGKKTRGYELHDVALTRSYRHGAWKWKIEARNVTDTRVEDIDGFPLPGTSYGMEMSWTR